MELGSVISQYLTSNRRLAIPRLGSFLVKEDGKNIIFLELLNKDDGILRQVLIDAGTTELTAIGIIDRFVFEIKHSLQDGESYPISRLGVFSVGADGSMAFEYNPLQGVEVHSNEDEEVIQTDNNDIQISEWEKSLQQEEVNEVVETENTAQDVTPTHKRPRTTKKKQKKVDIVFIIAIVVALISISALAYGIYCDYINGELF